MLYHLFEILESQFNLPGASLFGYLSFRAAVTVIMALLISIVFGKKIINYLKVKQVGENIRELGLEGEKKKAGTPTMGGIIIIIGTLVPVILMSNLENIYIQILIISSLILGTIGLIDDYIKVFKKDKKGLHGKFKIAGQSLLGIFIGIVLLTNNSISMIWLLVSDLLNVKSNLSLCSLTKEPFWLTCSPKMFLKDSCRR